MLRKWFVWLILTVLVGQAVLPAKAWTAREPLIVGKGAVLINGRTGEIIWSKNPDQKLYPASTTKILTTLLALEKGNLDDIVTVSRRAMQQEGSAIWLQEGEQISLRDLLYAVMLNSANDAAAAVAEHIGGSIENFAQMMNERARQAGAVNSHFANPNGLPNPDHYTTPKDLGLIAYAAMQNPHFREIVASKTFNIKRQDPAALTQLINHNKLLWRYPGANGIKTGYTVAARQCLVASAQRDGEEFIAVVLGSEGRNIWTDCTTLLDYGFNNFKTVLAAKAGEKVGEVPVSEGAKKAVAVLKEDLYVTVPKDQPLPSWGRAAHLLDNVQAPVEKGQKLGEMVLLLGDKPQARAEVVAESGVAKKKWASFVTSTGQVWSEYKWWFFGSGGMVLVGGYLLALARKKRRQQRRFSRYYYDDSEY
ncbi:D-alanyl-D-alanine carboxypeptidase (penicillin-binding protein 5/6) [Carboxydocella sporoproducens DSM 16521]|uniref:serine-type D-Ala-D-Ala carboxypeptidase n=2 Tax=Carboxydocella TaxID=178898 RepID=A0A1T4M2N0_9FIRM|nr:MULTISPECIES: D-alanyl-D-alanine carboxypeptidase family protein [Carboxydocella]AVX21072.1 D-alanyl-D-alanine carboxypeptidase (penicillin-binding protein 5/6) [Carboxydocella thermautotrophica]SJZ61181.1 D-alanyl-D-alanine carboxypeptidase (penicillin-binding protein 5/6) [Carboxydocella sporoproducens DSM 16521]